MGSDEWHAGTYRGPGPDPAKEASVRTVGGVSYAPIPTGLVEFADGHGLAVGCELIRPVPGEGPAAAA